MFQTRVTDNKIEFVAETKNYWWCTYIAYDANLFQFLAKLSGRTCSSRRSATLNFVFTAVTIFFAPLFRQIISIHGRMDPITRPVFPSILNFFVAWSIASKKLIHY
jgi:hypothetical protein